MYDDREVQNKLSYEQRRRFKDSFNQFIRQRSETVNKARAKKLKAKNKSPTNNILLDKSFIEKLDDPFSVSVFDQARDETPVRGNKQVKKTIKKKLKELELDELNPK